METKSALKSSSSWATHVLKIAFVAMAYYGAARMGLLLAFQKTNASPVWPPSGFAFAVVLLLGYRVWPGIFLGAGFANLVTLLAHRTVNPWLIVAASGLIGAGNTIEAVSGKFLLHCWIGSSNPLDRTQDVAKLIVATLLMCLTSSTIGSTALCLTGIVPWGLYKTVWFTWWLGDTAGVLILTPMLLTWFRSFKTHWSPLRLAETALLFGVLFAISQIIFGIWFPQSLINSQAYLVIPFLLWAVFRFGRWEAPTMVALVSGLAIWATIYGFGPFVRESVNASLISLQSFVCVVAVTMMLLAAALAERKRSQEDLQTANITLEQRVAERTETLGKQTEQLSRMNSELQTLLHVTSHDLREPLRAIETFASTIKAQYSTHLDEKGQNLLWRIARAASRLDQLLNDILELSRVRRTELSVEEIDSAAIAADVLSRLEDKIKQKGAKIKISPDLPRLRVDRRWAVEAIYNLVGNALKYTVEGAPPEIEIVSYQPSTNDPEEVGLVVQDRGPGVAPEHAERIFKLFQRAVGREVEGTGAGLAIVREIATHHGGRAWVRPREGGGSEFIVTFGQKKH